MAQIVACIGAVVHFASTGPDHRAAWPIAGVHSTQFQRLVVGAKCQRPSLRLTIRNRHILLYLRRSRRGRWQNEINRYRPRSLMQQKNDTEPKFIESRLRVELLHQVVKLRSIQRDRRYKLMRYSEVSDQQSRHTVVSMTSCHYHMLDLSWQEYVLCCSIGWRDGHLELRRNSIFTRIGSP